MIVPKNLETAVVVRQTSDTVFCKKKQRKQTVLSNNHNGRGGGGREIVNKKRWGGARTGWGGIRVCEVPKGISL